MTRAAVSGLFFDQGSCSPGWPQFAGKSRSTLNFWASTSPALGLGIHYLLGGQGLREEARVPYVVGNYFTKWGTSLNWLLLFIIMGNECPFCFLNRGALWPLPQFFGYFGEFDIFNLKASLGPPRACFEAYLTRGNWPAAMGAQTWRWVKVGSVLQLCNLSRIWENNTDVLWTTGVEFGGSWTPTVQVTMSTTITAALNSVFQIGSLHNRLTRLETVVGCWGALSLPGWVFLAFKGRGT